MKRVVGIIATLLMVAMLASAQGCAGAQPAQQAQPTQPAQPAQQPQATSQPAAKSAVKAAAMYAIMNPPRAGGWDRADWLGIQYLRNQLGWDVTVGEGVPYPQTAATAAGYAEKGYNPVIFTDNGQIDAFKEVAPKYPKTWFAMMSLADALPDSPNVCAWFPDFYVYGNMVGAVAAEASKSGKIGVIGGVPIPALITLYSGVIEGAKYVRPDASVDVAWVGDWNDVAKHREVTSLMTQKGEDVIFAVSGNGTTGVFDGAAAGGAKVIGYASDWYDDAPKAVLTSVTIDAARMYKEMGEQFVAGKMEKKMNSLGASYFGVADFRGSLPADTVQKIQDTVSKMQNGSITVPVKMHDELMKQ